MGLKATWERLGTLGVEERHSMHERRRIVVLNRALLIGVFVSISYLFIYAYADAENAVVINAGAVLVYSGALLLNRLRRQKLARHLGLFGANMHIFALSTLVLGEISGVHRWYWMFIVVAFLIFTRDEKRSIYAHAALSILLFTGIEHGFISFSHEPVVSESVAKIISVTSTVVTLGIITFIVDLFDRETLRAEVALGKEHQRSESLLLNILPRSIAARLKQERPEPIADSFREVTVLFADIAGFTTMSASLDPARVVALLNEVFCEFDELADRHGLEKIKTIGDAYMVAGGLPTPHHEHAHAVAEMALDMADVVQRYPWPGDVPLRIRIGVNSGPVVAGVIGVRKFIYDLWGDTVNTASRMESTGVIGAIQVTEATYELLKHDYEFEARGTIDVKGKGNLQTFLLVGRKQHAASRDSRRESQTSVVALTPQASGQR